VEVTEYAVPNNFHGAPAFVWWVTYILNKHSHIIAAFTKRYHKTTHIFGIEVSNSWDDCIILDKENGNILWQDAVRKEIKNAHIVFQIFNGDEAVRPTYQEMLCHMIFDVKMEDVFHNARFVAGGHTTDTPYAMTYASIL
jgi:hypothetical protein